MIISLAEYARLHNRSGAALRRLAESGALKTARKIGRNWTVDSEEAYPSKRKNKAKPITVVSLFSGCGGMDLGLLGGFDFLGKHYDKTGFDIIWANELNPAACKTYRENFGDYIIEGDIKDQIRNLPSKADVVVGGFPCQDISINGKMLGVNGTRSGLYTYIVEAVRKIQPKAFIAENVGGLLFKQNEDSLRQILRDFHSLGYNLNFQPYHAEDYGVPQTRERVKFVGTKKEYPEFVPPKPSAAVPVTAFEALHDLKNHPRDKAFSHIWSNAKVSGEQGNRRLIADRPGSRYARSATEIFNSIIRFPEEFPCAKRHASNPSRIRFDSLAACGKQKGRSETLCRRCLRGT